jgi:hypothetical protein
MDFFCTVLIKVFVSVKNKFMVGGVYLFEACAIFENLDEYKVKILFMNEDHVFNVIKLGLYFTYLRVN